METGFKQANKNNSQLQPQKEVVEEIFVDEDPLNIRDMLISLSNEMLAFLKRIKETLKRLGVLDAVSLFVNSFRKAKQMGKRLFRNLERLSSKRRKLMIQIPKVNLFMFLGVPLIWPKKKKKRTRPSKGRYLRAETVCKRTSCSIKQKPCETTSWNRLLLKFKGNSKPCLKSDCLT